MDNIEEKITFLEAKIKGLDKNISTSCLQELLTEVNIVDNLLEIFNNESFSVRLTKIKNEIQSKTSTRVYQASDKKLRINILSQGAEKILLMNQYINDCVNKQGNSIDLIEIETDAALHESREAYNQLLTRQDYLKRKNRFTRNIFILIFIFISLIFVRLLI